MQKGAGGLDQYGVAMGEGVGGERWRVEGSNRHRFVGPDGCLQCQDPQPLLETPAKKGLFLLKHCYLCFLPSLRFWNS